MAPSSESVQAFAEKKRQEARERLEYLREQLRAECISQGELIELQGLADYIDPGDVELLEPAGVPEFPDEEPDSVTLTIVLSGEGTHYLAALQDLEDIHAMPLAEATGTTGREALLALIDKIDLPPFEDTSSLTDDVGFWTGL